MINKIKETADRNWLGDADEIYKENILDHYKHPHNYGKVEGASFKGKEHNPLCGDNIEITIKASNGRITDIKFSGSGCAVSMASASMLTDKVKGMSIKDAKSLTKEDIFKMLGTRLGVVRMKCGLLGLKTLSSALGNGERK